MNNLKIINRYGQLVTGSREVAVMAGKRHSDLLESIDGYIKYLLNGKFRSVDFFIQSSYKDSTGRTLKCYLLTKKGCDMVANKMTGEKGILFTATYVTKFEEMENQLKVKKIDSYMIEDPIERARSWIKEHEEKLILEQRIFEYEPKISYLDTILNSTNAIVVTQIAADYGLSAKKLNEILKENEVQYKVNKQWILKAKYKDKGFTKSETFIDAVGQVRLNTKWTQKGRLFIHQLLESIGIKALMDLENIKVS